MDRKKLLKDLHSNFVNETGIRCTANDRGVARGGWVELILGEVDCEQMEKIAKFLRKNFSQPNLFSHLLPKLIPTNSGISLCFQDTEVERVYGQNNKTTKVI